MNKNIIKLFAILMMCFLIGSVLVACGNTNAGEEVIVQDGKDAVVTIVGGYWYINGENTGVKAEGEDGKNGTDATDCTNHDYNIYDEAGNLVEVNGNKWVIESHAHDCVPSIVAGQSKAATCTEGGYDTLTCTCPRGILWVCADCGDAKFQWTAEKTWQGNFTQALGHNYVGVYTAPTCIEKGYTTYTCTTCGDTYVEESNAALAAHTYGAWEPKIYPDTACKCTLPVEENRFCTVDGCTAQEYRKLSDAPGHKFNTWEPTIDTTATTSPCERVDLEVSYCDACNHKECNEVRNKPGDVADGHTWGEWTVVTAPTTEKEGLIERKCSKCTGYSSSTEQKKLPALNKTDYTWAVVTAPDCDEAGKDSYTYTINGQALKFEVTVAADGHNYTNGKYENLKAPKYPQSEEEVESCNGSVDVVCDVCGAKKTVVIPALTKEHSKSMTTVGNCLNPVDKYEMSLNVDGYQVFVEFSVINPAYVHDDAPAHEELTVLNGEETYLGYWCNKCQHWILVEKVED